MAKKKRLSLGQFFYWLRYRIGEICLRGFVWILPRTARPLLRSLTVVSARISFIVLRKYRKRMEENLTVAMGRGILTQEERSALVVKVWQNFAYGFLEAILAMYASEKEILSMVRIEEEENLKKAFTKGKGVIALSAHLGNFMMIGIGLAAAGYPFNVVVKHPRDRRFARLFDDYRARVGIKTISSRPRREATRQILKALRKNEVVLLVADEFKSGGVEVEFLGRRVSAQRGPVTLAMRTGAPLLPIFATRDEKDHLTLHIGSELDLTQTGNVQEDVDANVALFTHQLERMVRRYPEQWSWLGFHRNGRKPRSKMRTYRTAPRNPSAPLSS